MHHATSTTPHYYMQFSIPSSRVIYFQYKICPPMISVLPSLYVDLFRVILPEGWKLSPLCSPIIRIFRRT